MTVFIFLGSLLGAMALGIPIAYALLASGVALMWHLDLFDAQILAQNFINGADSFPLLAVPFFMLAGEIMNVGGLSQRIVNFALALVGHVKGGLGYVVILAACLLSALSGSAVADAAALTALLLPMMIKAGHDKRVSGGLIAAAGVIGPIIPPSIGFVIFGVAANVSISKLFIAGIVPGIMIGLALALTWWWVGRKEALVLPQRKTRAEMLTAARESLWALMLPVFILVGLRMGVFTPTEAAVVAAVYALFVSTVVYRELELQALVRIFVTAARTTAVVMFLVASAMVSAWLITVANLPAQVVDLLRPLLDNQTLLLIAIMLLVMLVGTAMDMTPTILILTPVLMPLIKAAGIDPVYFGVLFIINNSIGLVTPPVGTILNVVAGVGRMKMDEVTRGVLPFMVAQFAMLFVMVLFPQTVLVPLRWFY
ncbi:MULTISPECIES: TRAP transporter large permease subunit [unclassified Rhizobacter]|uniref:TRAP transporter large permease subunit n=1 Tax=unclassified Rhizobacter TaxID=2640088 RepID=UPI0006FF4E99|nr:MULTISPECIES: TRAP transporter large permease subunit [unclassified Rhizobacter]KQU81086.1 L-dehydroascorbate transporter large permease subunit [Rhizobacter sp. Root29]KQW04630.1 L-dehydroascorbate transporter large permease subunit [Rhizobacter sp. Root1238]KRB06469.1 L-dehydroascorbate transporter large permease subunit [Rhizobacter sp. Root16D2]